MRSTWLLAAIAALCLVVHARALPAFATKFLLPDNTAALADVPEMVRSYIADLVSRNAINIAQNYTLHVALGAP